MKALVEIIKSNIQNFMQSYHMSRLALKKMYSGSALGIGWSIVKPTLFILVYWFGIQVGIRGGKSIDPEIPFILWLVSGIIPWFFINDILSRASGSIRQYSYLVTKMVFPVETIPVFNTMAYFNTHLLMFGIVTAIFIISGFGLSIYFVQSIYYLMCIFLFASVLCMFLSTLSVISKDFQQLVKSTTTVFFWMTPIIWKIESLPGIWRTVMKLNPIYYFIEGYRNTFLYQKWFFESPKYMLYFWGFLLVFALLTAFLYKKLSKEFADVL